MKINVLTPVQHDAVHYPEGPAEVDEKVGNALIERGLAEKVAKDAPAPRK